MHDTAREFLSRLTNSPTIPDSSILITFISIAHGGLGLTDPHTVTMSSATRVTTHGFHMG
jgi:hypothetical protein